MPWLNLYKPPTPPETKLWHSTTPSDSYDVNFCFAAPEQLESAGVKLIPMIPSLHGSPLYSLLAKYPHVYDHLPSGPFTTEESFFTYLERWRADSTSLLFTILDQSLVLPSTSASADDTLSPLRVAGFIMAIHCSEPNRTADIGLAIAPPFQRSHVTTHAVSLVLRWLFDEIGLRKIVWTANDKNKSSVATANRFGLKQEGLLRWHYVLAPGKTEGWPLPEGASEEEHRRGLGRHSYTFGLGWDDWKFGLDGSIPAKDCAVQCKKVLRMLTLKVMGLLHEGVHVATPDQVLSQFSSSVANL